MYIRGSRSVPYGNFFITTTLNRREQLSFSWTSIRSFTQKIANIWRTKGDGISVIKFEAAGIHFLTDVFVPVAVIVA